MEVVFFRCALATAFCFVGLYRAKADWKGSNQKMLLLRGLFGTLGALFLFYYAAEYPACVGDDDPISVADLYEHHRDLCS